MLRSPLFAYWTSGTSTDKVSAPGHRLCNVRKRWAQLVSAQTMPSWRASRSSLPERASDGEARERLAAGRGLVQANGSSNEGRESLLIDFIVLVEVDCAPGVAFEA